MKRIIFTFSLAFCYLIGCSQQQGNFKDIRDGKVYKTVKIGDQWVMAENFAYKPSSGSFWAYENDNSKKAKYGYLYDWKTAVSIAPSGWHLPTKEEWAKLIGVLGDSSKVVYERIIPTGSSGFMVLFGGFRFPDGVFPSETFAGIDTDAAFWSSSSVGTNKAWRFYCHNTDHTASLDFIGCTIGFSVRLFKDN
jgi:uncharacterized protein (TIGR02145 family)